MNRIAVAIIALAMTGALAAGQAVAQMPGGGRGPSGSSGGSHLPAPKPVPESRPADQPVTLAGQVQASLDRMADEIRINPAQQKAWDAYATRIIRLADDISRARFAARNAQNAYVTTPQLFDRIAETAQNRLTAIEEIVESGRALYAMLSPEQQRLADRRLALVPMALASSAPNDDGSLVGTPPRKP